MTVRTPPNLTRTKAAEDSTVACARVCIGEIRGAFGVGGEVRIRSFAANPADVARYGPLESGDGKRQIQIRAMRPVRDGFAARLDGVETREQALDLRGVRLFVPRERLPEPEDGEYYIADLVGLTALDVRGGTVGKVIAVHDFGAGNIFEIQPADDKEALLVPFTHDAVPAVGATHVVVADLFLAGGKQ